MILLVSAGKSDGQRGITTSKAPAPIPVQIEVVFMEGEVLIDGQEPGLGDMLGTNFIVQTGKGARCDLVFNTGNALSVGQNALADFDFSSQMFSSWTTRILPPSSLLSNPLISIQTICQSTPTPSLAGTGKCWLSEPCSWIMKHA
ncbi:MAG: hypothetical protein AB7T74_17425 [Clostridia bacterium]